MGGKEREFRNAVSTSACVPFLRSVPIASVVLTPILTSFVVGLALVDGEHGGKKSRRSWLSALRISIDLVEIDLDRCEAWEQQQGPPARLSRPAAPSQQPNLALSQTAPRLTPSSTLLPTRKRGVGLVSSVSRAFLPKRSAHNKRDASFPPLPVSHGLTPIAWDIELAPQYARRRRHNVGVTQVEAYRIHGIQEGD